MIFTLVQIISMIKLETDGLNYSMQTDNFLTLSYFNSNDL